MYKGFLLSESLRNPTILNRYTHLYVRVEEHAESKELPFWHLFKIEVPQGDIASLTEEVAREIKETWYAHFWNKETVYIVLPGRIFMLPREERWESEEFGRVKAYALQHGIEERYLDFRIED